MRCVLSRGDILFSTGPQGMSRRLNLKCLGRSVTSLAHGSLILPTQYVVRRFLILCSEAIPTHFHDGCVKLAKARKKEAKHEIFRHRPVSPSFCISIQPVAYASIVLYHLASRIAHSNPAMVKSKHRHWENGCCVHKDILGPTNVAKYTPIVADALILPYVLAGGTATEPTDSMSKRKMKIVIGRMCGLLTKAFFRPVPL